MVFNLLGFYLLLNDRSAYRERSILIINNKKELIWQEKMENMTKKLFFGSETD